LPSITTGRHSRRDDVAEDATDAFSGRFTGDLAGALAATAEPHSTGRFSGVLDLTPRFVLPRGSLDRHEPALARQFRPAAPAAGPRAAAAPVCRHPG
jgi:hypothetical protein